MLLSFSLLILWLFEAACVSFFVRAIRHYSVGGEVHNSGRMSYVLGLSHFMSERFDLVTEFVERLVSQIALHTEGANQPWERTAILRFARSLGSIHRGRSTSSFGIMASAISSTA
jgi:hypothetical protein